MRPSSCALLVAALMAAAAASVNAGADAATQGKYQAEVLGKVNQIRQSRGLPALRYSQAMDSAAARHSTDMAGKSMLSHSGSDGSRPADRLRVAGGGGFSATAENVAMIGGGSSPDRVIGMWMGSQGHRDNMLNGRYTHMGVAQASAGGRVYWTLMLGGN